MNKNRRKFQLETNNNSVANSGEGFSLGQTIGSIQSDIKHLSTMLEEEKRNFDKNVMQAIQRNKNQLAPQQTSNRLAFLSLIVAFLIALKTFWPEIKMLLRMIPGVKI